MTARYHQPASARHIQTADLFIEEESNFQYQHAVPLTAPAPQAARQGPQPQVHHHHHYERPLSLLPKHEVTPFTGSGEPSPVDCFREDLYGYLEASNIDANTPTALSALRLLIKGIAREEVSASPVHLRDSVAGIFRLLSDRFESHLRAEEAVSAFFLRRQRPNESVIEFSTPLQSMYRSVAQTPQGSWGSKGRLHLLFTGNMFEPTQYFERFKATDEERLRLCSPSSLPEIKR